MFSLYYGTDKKKVRDTLDKSIKKVGKGAHIVRITDANTVSDLEVSIRGGGMFAELRVIVFENTLENNEMRPLILEALSHMKDSHEQFFILEEKLDAATKKQIEKYADVSEKLDAVKKTEPTSIFAIANALKKGDRKALWVHYQTELIKGSAPEAIHGVLFWGAKDMHLKSHEKGERARAQNLVRQLAELPHEARRNGEDLEYALERFTLSKL